MTPRSPSSIVGIFGGSFDPPHAGHVLFVAYALAVAPIDRLLIVPTFQHPFGKPMAPFADRAAMADRAFGGLGAASVSRIEEELGGASYTVRTLDALVARMPDTTFRLLIGADVLAETSRWREWERVAAMAPPFVIGRSGVAAIGAAPSLPAISSTAVRARYAAGEGVEYLVPREVDAYVRAHGLYGTSAP